MSWLKCSSVMRMVRTVVVLALFALFLQQSVTALLKFLDRKTSYHITLKVM